MKKITIAIVTLMWTVLSVQAADFFSTAYVETYRTDLGTTMVSPNLYFKYGKLEGYGFIDRYMTDEAFYHGEFQLAFSPFSRKYFDRIAVISESRWDKYAKQENSLGLRFKLW